MSSVAEKVSPTAPKVATDSAVELSAPGKDDSSNDDLPSIIEQFDQNYIEETSKLPLGDAANIDPLDHVAMRAWIKDAYVKLPSDPQIKRRRPRATITTENQSITYDTTQHFRVRIYDPAPDPGNEDGLRPALLTFHGGGWIHGFPEVDENISKFLASEVRAVVVGVDYRLAPEHPFPAGVNDGFEALNWVLDHAADYKIDPKRIGLWGASAGGNIAAAVCLKDSNTHEVTRVRHVNLVVPAVSTPALFPAVLKSKNASMRRFPFNGSTPEDTFVGVEQLWKIYAGDQVSDPYASVLHATPSSNHPPVHVTVAGCDGLRDEGIAYALKLRNAGIDTQLEVIPGVPHGVNLSPTTWAAEQYFRNQARVLNCALNSDY